MKDTAADAAKTLAGEHDEAVVRRRRRDRRAGAPRRRACRCREGRRLQGRRRSAVGEAGGALTP